MDVLAFEAYGVGVALELADPVLSAEVEAVLPPCAREISDDTTLARFAVTRPDGMSVSAAANRLASELRQYVALRSPSVFIHAGVVAVGTSALVLPGRSRTGKTTLVSALLARGADYMSDEYAVLDEHGCVHPFPKPLSIRDGDPDRSRAVPAADLGASMVQGPRCARLVVGMPYAPREPTARTPLSPADGILLLMNHAVAARTRPAIALQRVRLLCERAIVQGGRRGDANASAADLLELLHALEDGRHDHGPSMVRDR